MDFFLFHFILFIDAAIICLASSLSNIQKVEEEEEEKLAAVLLQGYNIISVEYMNTKKYHPVAILCLALASVVDSKQPAEPKSKPSRFFPARGKEYIENQVRFACVCVCLHTFVG